MGADGRHTGKRHKQRHRHTRHRDLRFGGVPDDLCHPGGHSSNSEHDDGRLGDRVRRGHPIHQWGLGWGLGQPVEHDIVLSRCFGRVFGERNDGAIEQRSGVGAVPAVRSLGNAALPSRDRSLLRALMELGDVTRAGESRTYRSVSKVWPGNIVARLHPDQAPATGLFGLLS